MGKLFISYRRSDSQGWAGRLGEHLTRSFGDVALFFDIESVRPGDEFALTINDALSAADAMLVLIGPNWLTASSDDGRHRLEEPGDFVVLEIAAALRSGIRVIPVLLGGTTMPNQTQLPPQIAALAGRQAFTLSDTRWNYDYELLADAIEAQSPLRRVVSPAADHGTIVRVGEGLVLDDVHAGNIAGTESIEPEHFAGSMSVEVAKGATIRNSTLGNIVGMTRKGPGKHSS